MAEDCSHGHHYHHHHHVHIGVAEGITESYAHKLRWAMALAVVYLFAQVVGSIYSGSLALLAEAGHKLADVGSIALALFATWFAGLPSSPQKTFGYYRMEILAALVNGMVLFGMAIYILYEAYQRVYLGGHHHVEGGIMMAVAGFGLIINVVAARILYPARELNLNVKGALFHIMADILGSTGTILTALGIYFLGWDWLDTVISIIISLLVMVNAIRIFREALNILMETAPPRLNVDHIKRYIHETIPGVLDVHDLHVWTITTGKEALLAHVKVNREAFHHETVMTLEKSLRENFDLCHITVQLEPPGFEEEAIEF